jgi:hypothetical protein
MQSSEELAQADREALRRALEEYGALNDEAEGGIGQKELGSIALIRTNYGWSVQRILRERYPSGRSGV